MLIEYRHIEPWLEKLLLEDPVRPSIKPIERVSRNHSVFVLWKDDKPASICCAALLDYVPAIEEELFEEGHEHFDHACLYTIWSLSKGSGRLMIQTLLPYLRKKYHIERVITLSPTTEMAKTFHLSNGAVVYRINEDVDTVNYEYELYDV